MGDVEDRPDLLSRLGRIQYDLVLETHRMARAASALQELPHGRDPHEALSIVLRAACEHLGFDRAFAYLAQAGGIALRFSWPERRRTAGWLERRVIETNRPAASRSGKTVVAPLVLSLPLSTRSEAPFSSERTMGALRLEGGAARRAGGDALAPIMRFAEAVALALENAILVERTRSQGSQIESLSGRLVEADHRIKNNLQGLAGFLLEHERGRPDPSRADALRAAVGRIKAIAALHDALACVGEEAVDLSGLARRICSDVAALYPAGRRVQVIVAADSVRASPAVSRAFALVLHELVSNAVQHAYPGARCGDVRVCLRRSPARLALEVADDGVGLPQPGGPARRGLGLSVAAAIAENELGGKLELTGEKGTTARLEFPLMQMA